MPKKSAQTQVGTSEAAGEKVIRQSYAVGPLEVDVVQFNVEPGEVREILATELNGPSEAVLDTIMRVIHGPLQFSDHETEGQRQARLNMAFLYNDRERIIETFQGLGFYGETDDTSAPIVLHHEDERFYATYYGRVRFEGTRIILETLTPHQGNDHQGWHYFARDFDLLSGYFKQRDESERGKSRGYQGVPYNEDYSHSNIPEVFLSHMHSDLSELGRDAATNKRKLDVSEFDFDVELEKIRTERGVDSDYAMGKRIPELISGITSYGNPQLGEKSEGMYRYTTDHMTITVGASIGVDGEQQVGAGSVQVEYTDVNGYKVVEQYSGLAGNPEARRHTIRSEDPAKSNRDGNYLPVTHEDLVELRSLLEGMLHL